LKIKSIVLAVLYIGKFRGAVLGNDTEFADGKVLFEDDFKIAAGSRDKYEEIVKGSYEGNLSEVKFCEGFVQLLAPWAQETGLRTSADMRVEDDGIHPVYYSVQAGAASKSPLTVISLMVRLGRNGFNSGYEIQQYYDGRNAILSIIQIYRGRKELFRSKCPGANPEYSGNEFPQLLSDNPDNILSARLENVAEGVKISVYFNGELLKTILEGAGQISSRKIPEGDEIR
jgi:hypothetical protein